MRNLRHIPRPGSLVEVTSRTIQGRYLLRPGTILNQRILGILAKAQMNTAMPIHAVVVMSSHFHFLLSPQSVEQLARFMQHVKTNISKEIKKIYDWQGPVFDRRYDHIPVSDEDAAQIARMKYLLSHGCKEGLVMKPADWPGVQTVTSVTRGKALIGQWINRTKAFRNRAGHRGPEPPECIEEIELKIDPLPCWAHLTKELAQQKARALVQEIEEEHRNKHRKAGTIPAGRKSILRLNPKYKPSNLKRSNKPRFHAFSKKTRKVLEQAYTQFYAAYRAAAKKLQEGIYHANFPENCFPPRLPFVQPENSFDSS